MNAFDHRETAAHYETLLAPIYAWMVGDVDAARAAASVELRRLGIGPPEGGRRALDLGAGIGVHAVPLAALGYQVTAIDSSSELLAELARACPAVTTISGDLLAARETVTGPFDLVVCMGDTLTHLASPAAVRSALAGAGGLLAAEGTLAITFRDYTRARHGAERFFLVRGDDNRILTCCLDYEGDRVSVTDILHQRTGDDPRWQMRASTYHKLRLTASEVGAALTALGLTVTQAGAEGGWITLVARAGERQNK